MGNIRSKSNAGGGDNAAAVVAALDESRSSNNGSKKSNNGNGNGNHSSSSNKKKSKNKDKYKKEFKKVLHRQDSYTNAILHQQQQQEHQEALHNGGVPEAVSAHSLPTTATTRTTTTKDGTSTTAVSAVVLEDIRSMHSSLVRDRDGVPVHQIYDIIAEIGHGGVCKVFRIQKKQEYIGGSSRPQHVVIPRSNSNSSIATLSSNAKLSSRWFIKTLQSLGTITIRSPPSPPPQKDDAGEGEEDSYLDPWNSPELRFLYLDNHHHRHHHHGDSSADNSASSDNQQQQQQTPAATNDNNGSSNKPMYFALKVINLVMVQEDKIAQLKNEVEILKTLDHPNIIKVYETFNTKRQVMMIMELCTGGDLYARMPYTEKQVADMLRQILLAIRYIHARHIVHRDIKMENIMFESTHPQAAIKVIDFGLSKKYSTNHSHHNILTERVGTLYSMSPETMRGIAYTSQADLWSLGVVTFILLANGRVQPFEGKNPKQVVANVLRGRFSFNDNEIWGHVSTHAKDFISNLLVLEPERRLTASTAREHPWFAYCKNLQECQQPLEPGATAALDNVATSAQTRATNSATASIIAVAAAAFVPNTTNNEYGSQRDGDDAETSFKSIDSDASKMEEFKNRVCTSLAEYADMSEFRKLALNIIAKKSSSSEIFELRKVFEEFDYLGTGTITLEAFSAALSQFHYSPHDIHKIFTKIDINRDNAINYTEFLAAALETQGTIEEYRLAEAFDLMDDDDSGYISHENLRKILPRAKYSDAYVDQLIAEGDFKGDGKISYEEFLQVFAKKKHDRIKAIYYDSSNRAASERNVTDAAHGDDDDDDDDSSKSTDDILRRYGILTSLRRGFGSTERGKKLFGSMKE